MRSDRSKEVENSLPSKYTLFSNEARSQRDASSFFAVLFVGSECADEALEAARRISSLEQAQKVCPGKEKLNKDQLFCGQVSN